MKDFLLLSKDVKLWKKEREKNCKTMTIVFSFCGDRAPIQKGSH